LLLETKVLVLVLATEVLVLVLVLDSKVLVLVLVDSTFYPPWDGKMSTSQRALMFCGWGVKSGMV